MAYEKQTWTDGEIVSSEKLNHIEQGLNNVTNVMTVSINYDNDKENYFISYPWNRLYEIFITNNTPIICKTTFDNSYSFEYITNITSSDTKYSVYTSENEFFTDTETGYPYTIKTQPW